MSKLTSWGAPVAAVAVAILVSFARADEPKTAPATDTFTVPLAKRHCEFKYAVDIPEFPKDAKRVELWVPVPQDDENQAIGKIVTNPQSEIQADLKTGNKFAHFAFDSPFPKSFNLEMTVEVTRRERIRKDFRGKGATPLSDDDKAKYADALKADKLVPLDGKIAELSKTVGGDEKNILNLGRRYYDYVLGLMRYDKSGEGWGRGDALWACDSKYGNCTDFHSVFIGLCRARGIPARFAMGFSIPEARGAGAVGGYHCWAEFFVPGYGWVPVDISEADKHPELAEYYFGAHTEDRVEFTRGRDITLAPPQKGDPVNFIIYPYAEIDGKKLDPKKWDGVKRSFAYKDLQ